MQTNGIISKVKKKGWDVRRVVGSKEFDVGRDNWLKGSMSSIETFILGKS